MAPLECMWKDKSDLQPHRIDMPDLLGILLNRPVGGEVTHIGDVVHRFCGPLFRRAIELVDLILAINIAAEISQHLIVVTKVDQ